MNKIIEKYLESLNDESVSSSAGMGFAIDNPYGFVQKTSYPKNITPKLVPSIKNKKRKILMDEQPDEVINKKSEERKNGK